MSKRRGTATKGKKGQQKLEKVRRIHELTEYQIPGNGLRVLFARRPGTGVVTSNILYFVGSRDEARGETGVAHMLEHMLFKPTSFDVKRKTDSASMTFERELGVTLNANTWKDRTTYYFSYPKTHLDRALQVEAERMRDVIISDKEFKPERTNVLSEFDMYAGDPEFSLAVEMSAAAFQSHTYGHETIGFREDIESYTKETLQRFYENFYAPENAVLVIVGDVSEKEMESSVLKHFAHLKNPKKSPVRFTLREPKQEGLRQVEVRRQSETNVYALGVKHAGFPSRDWFLTMATFDMLAGGVDSILHRALVDTGLAARIESTLEPTKDPNLAILFLTLAGKSTHEAVEKRIYEVLSTLTVKAITPYLKKTIAKAVTHEHVSRENSLGYVAELVEYVSAGDWGAFFDTEKILTSITPAEVLAHARELFKNENTTVGRFVGIKK